MRIILIILLLTLVFVFSLHTLTSVNQDIGRHLRLGELIWQSKEVPKTNLFSYTNPDFPFINHHWLGEVFLYLGSLAVGLKGLIVLKAFLITAAFALAFFAFLPAKNSNFKYNPRGLYLKYSEIIPAVIAGIISTFILIERTDVRPEIFSFLFLGWYLFVLFRKSDSKLFLWSLPLVQLLWVNTHIYFFLGPLIFILFVIGKFIDTTPHLKISFLKSASIIAIAVIGANLLNPNGLAGALYPLTAFNNYGYSIVENQGPFFLKAWGYPWLTTWSLFIGIIFVAISFLANLKNFRKNQSTQTNLSARPSPQKFEGSGIFEFLLFVVSVALSLKMIRNYPIFALALIPISLKNFREALPTIMRMRPRWEYALAIFLVILIFSVVGNQIYESSNLGRRFGLIVPEGAQKAIDFVRENDLRGPIFNNFDVGSFLIWKLPEEKVFIDGRPEAYGADFIQNIYIPMQEDPQLWEKYSKEYGINYVFWLYTDITPWSQKFLNHITKNPDWSLIYRDDSVMIFKNSNPG